MRFATRPSALARRQTRWVIAALQQAWPGIECSETVITTQGDRILDRPLPEIGGKGVFTQELENELLGGKVDAAVHSLKDLPVEDIADLAISAIPERGEVRDVLISAEGYTLESLPEGGVVGTSSVRRSAQLLAYRPDLRIEPLRGNVDTRVRKALQAQYDAILLAGAGIARLGLADHISQWLPLEVMLPAPGQGALAVQCRADDAETQAYLAPLENRKARLAVTAERAFLTGLGGGCSLPVAAYAWLQDGRLHLSGLVASPDGKPVIRLSGRAVADDIQQAHDLGADLASQALTEGAGRILPVSPGR